MGLKQNLIDAKIMGLKNSGADDDAIDEAKKTLDEQVQAEVEALVEFLTECEFRVTKLNANVILEDFEDMTSGNSGGEENIDEEPEIETAKSLDEALKNLVSNTGADSTYFELPEVYLDRLIVPNDFIYNRCH